jgi:hypothetical protein
MILRGPKTAQTVEFEQRRLEVGGKEADRVETKYYKRLSTLSRRIPGESDTSKGIGFCSSTPLTF